MTSPPEASRLYRTTVLIPLVVFLAALLLRLGYAARMPVPFSGDSDYYAMVGENLYEGRGLVADYVWNYFAGIPEHLPVPSNEYWMPGPSFAIAGAFAVAGRVSDRIAQLPSIIFDALLCALTAILGILVFRRRDVAVLASGFCVISFHLVTIAAYPDPFTMSGLFVNLGLLSLWAAGRTTPYYGALAGVCAGLAYLCRTDGLLLAGAAAVFALDLALRQRKWKRATLLAVTFAVSLSLVGAPWLVRQTRTFAGPAGAGALRVAFASDFADIFRVDTSVLTLSNYLRANPTAQLGYKTYVLLRELLVLGQLVGPMLLIFWLPLRDRRTRRDVLPWLAYMALSLVIPAYVFPHTTVHGSFAHLGTGFMPMLSLLAVKGGLDLASTLPRPVSVRLRIARWIPLAAVIASLPAWWAMYPTEARRVPLLRYPQVAQRAKTEFAPRVAMTDMAWGLWHAARIPCAQFPAEGPEAALRVADSLGADYLIIMADAFQRAPEIRGVATHSRFRRVARYPAMPADLLVYQILPVDTMADARVGSLGPSTPVTGSLPPP